MSENKKNAQSGKTGRTDHSILVVDDNAGALAYTSGLISGFGYQTMTAASAKQAIAAGTRIAPSLVVISLELAGMTGFKCMRQLRNNPSTAHIPFIGLVTRDSKDLKDRCLEHGATACLRRPVDAETLFRTVQSAIEKNPRSSMRVKAILPVKVYGKAHEALYGAYALALSTGGMFLRTMSPVSVNSKIALEFDLNGRAIAAESVVIYNCQAGCGPDMERGIGLRFTDIAQKDQDNIRHFIRDEVMKGVCACPQ